MGLVDDDRVVLLEHAVAVDLGEQDAVGHQFDASVRTDPIGESHLIADELTELLPEFLGDALGDGAGRDTTRLRVTDAGLSEFEQHFRELRRFSGAGFAGHDHDLVRADCGEEVVAALADGQVGRVHDSDCGRLRRRRRFRGCAGSGRGNVGGRHQPSIVRR